MVIKRETLLKCFQNFSQQKSKRIVTHPGAIFWQKQVDFNKANLQMLYQYHPRIFAHLIVQDELPEVKNHVIKHALDIIEFKGLASLKEPSFQSKELSALIKHAPLEECQFIHLPEINQKFKLQAQPLKVLIEKLKHTDYFERHFNSLPEYYQLHITRNLPLNSALTSKNHFIRQQAIKKKSGAKIDRRSPTQQVKAGIREALKEYFPNLGSNFKLDTPQVLTIEKAQILSEQKQIKFIIKEIDCDVFSSRTQPTLIKVNTKLLGTPLKPKPNNFYCIYDIFRGEIDLASPVNYESKFTLTFKDVKEKLLKDYLWIFYRHLAIDFEKKLLKNSRISHRYNSFFTGLGSFGESSTTINGLDTDCIGIKIGPSAQYKKYGIKKTGKFYTIPVQNLNRILEANPKTVKEDLDLESIWQ